MTRQPCPCTNHVGDYCDGWIELDSVLPDECICGHTKDEHSGDRADDFECMVVGCSCDGFFR